ncbi:cytosolic phospholipase A2-like [Gigantopelta aegis]|uniref:cytosolic phospholipase A2-like n=1 Tax=Gigantopelta aegis TaxID=1735272 RepID=UPI001B88B8A8|nr:cytosolic phospholipase A2-like [Gigantopelta aegis]
MTAKYVGEVGFNAKGDTSISQNNPNVVIKSVQFETSRVTPSKMGSLTESAQQVSPNVFTKPSFSRRQYSKRRTSSSTSSSSLDHVDDSKDPPTPPLSPSSRKSRKMDGFGNSFDPYQVFQVDHLPCMILKVRVVKGQYITKGWAQDFIDTPDPYISLRVRTAPEGRKRTKTIDNTQNPIWNETFTFYLDFRERNTLQITLMEANTFIDQQLGTQYFDINRLRWEQWQKETFIFNEVSEVYVEMMLCWDKNPTLRYSLCLCDDEKTFLERRKQKVLVAMRKLLGEDQGPKNLSEVPNIGVIGSGGGFRAMVAFSGVFKALADSGILDCTTYACGLSGSSWYISTLYSHPKWPEMKPGDIQDEIKNNIDSSIMWLLKPQSVYRYLERILQKRREGQPVSFTDFFGHMVGETLLKGRLDMKLTDQRDKISEGDTPMPLYTCVHVKKDVPARSFQEWVEFSPYEIGLPKYGTFMDSKLFGSKFFMGKLCRKYEEPPLHFLQGIWGSAFCILFKRLLEDNRKLDPAEMIRQELGKELERNQLEDSDTSDCSDEEDDVDDDIGYGSSNNIHANNSNGHNLVNGSSSSSNNSSNINGSSINKSSSSNSGNSNSSSSSNSSNSSTITSSTDDRQCTEDSQSDAPSPKKQNRVSFNPDVVEVEIPRPIRPNNGLTRAASTHKSRQWSYWHNMLQGVFENKKFELLSTRAGRAAVIHNFMRGLSLQKSYPMSPFTPIEKRINQGDEFDGNFEMHPTNIKHIYMVDAGLTFNSPYPLVLRPQRGVDIILSFDFSARPSDSTEPFKELLLAEQWAKVNRLPFPPIDRSVFDREGMKELYIFKHPTDPYCPVVLHFVLVNINFRQFSKPGVPRTTKEDLDFADFDLFDDPATPYSTFNFKYTHEQFTRLAQLTEFNTLLNVDEIKKTICECIQRKRDNPRRGPVGHKAIKLLRMQSIKELKRRKKMLQRVESHCTIGASQSSMSSPETPYFQASDEHPLSQASLEKVTSSMQMVEEDSVTSDRLKERRRTLTRQNTLGSLNSITESCSLDSPEIESKDLPDGGGGMTHAFYPFLPHEHDMDDDSDDGDDDEDDDIFYDAQPGDFFSETFGT